MSSRKGAKTLLTTPAAHKRVVRVNGTISVGELGKAIGVKAKEVMNRLFQMGVMITINEHVDLDTAALIATEYDYEVKNVAFDEGAVLSGPVDVAKVEEDPDAVLRAPVVTIMGHVDHGKTTLLDRIRSANVASGEAGGITQHIGAYRVETARGPVVFLDTPGHAAFTSMRARGAAVTDLVVLVVAADDGVMPQTEESINHARAAGVPLIIAINKIDKPGIDPERIKQELTKFELVPEEWGGETMMLPISALRGDGVDNLLESLALQAEVLELKANPNKPAFGRVVEARIEKGRGTVVTVLVQEGTLKQGDYMVAGSHLGRVRALLDNSAKRLKSVGPSTPVEVLGLGGLPRAGDVFYTAKNEKAAKKVVANRDTEAKHAADAVRKNLNAADLLAAMGRREREKQNIILKTDVSGSLEALRQSLEQLATDEVEVKLVHTAVGGISESDIDLASASNSTIVGFNVGPDAKAKRAADQAGVNILRYSVIYDVLDSVKEMLSGLLEPETIELALGKAEVRAVFHIQKVGSVAGSFVLEGKMVRNAVGRIRRDGELVYEGKISTLKRFKDDVREVASGYECGLSVDGYKDIREGDIIEAVEFKQVKRKID
jgi:translation initiation factor IF-2